MGRKKKDTYNSDQLLQLIRKMPTPIPPGERRALTIKSVKAGGFLNVKGITHYVEELGLYIELDENTLKPTKWEWSELKCVNLTSGEVVYLEWEEDDKIEITVTTNSELKMRDIGLSNSDFGDLYEEEDGEVTYGGRHYEVDESADVGFYRNGDKSQKPEIFRSVEFWDDDDERFIGIENWDGTIEVSVGCEVLPNDIEVMSIGGE